MSWMTFLACAAAVVMGLALAYAGRDHEPRYDGRSLSEWVVALTDYSPDGEPEQAEEAIRQIGTNALPFLVQYCRYRPARWRLKSVAALEAVGEWLGRDWGQPPNRCQVRAEGALAALRIFGPEAAVAIPTLTQILETPGDDEHTMHAIFALGYIGIQALPPLMTVLTNSPSPLRSYAAMSLCALNTNAGPAVPSLVAYLRATNALAEYAVLRLGQLQQEPGVVVPALISALQDSRPEIRYAAARALQQFGDQARSAAPALVNLMTDPESDVSEGATNAVRAIVPELFADTPRPVGTQ